MSTDHEAPPLTADTAAPTPGSAPPTDDEVPKRSPPASTRQSDDTLQDTNQPSDGDGKKDQPPTEDTESAEEYGSKKFSADLLEGAKERATESLALDAAMQTFGLQTNQQINYNYFGPGPMGSAVGQMALPERTLARARRYFVKPPGYSGVWDCLEDRMLVILTARPGSGRQYTATRLLDAICDGRVQHLVGGTIVDMGISDIADDTGYLWTDVSQPEDRQAVTHHVDRLVDALRIRRSRMVILSPAGADWSFQVSDHCRELTDPPDLDEIVRIHLRTDGKDEGQDSAIEDLLAHPAVKHARAKLIGAEAAAGLGAALQEVLSGLVSVEDAMHKAETIAEGTTEWFARLPGREDRALALALGALDGLSYPTVIEGARQLDELIQRTQDPEGKSFLRPFERPAKRLFETVEVSKSRDFLETSYGKVPVTTLASSRDNFAREMLGAMWEGFPYLQEVYLGWLNDLVASEDPYVRGRAAVATGILAEADFDYVRGRLLLDWARDGREDVRRAAAVALRAPALNEQLRDIVWKMLDEWVTAKHDRREGEVDDNCRMTAAAALGGPVGATDFRRSLKLITDRLLEYKSGAYQYRHWSIVSNAVVELFGDGGSAQSAAVLKQVQTWAGSRKSGPQDIAIACFIGIVGRPPKKGVEDMRRLSPILRAVGDDDNLVAAASLWRQALNHRVMGEIAIKALRQLVDMVREGDESEEALGILVCAIPQTPRERRLITYLARTWAQGASNAAIFGRLYDVLRSNEVPR
jgi:hypothetical protein